MEPSCFKMSGNSESWTLVCAGGFVWPHESTTHFKAAVLHNILENH